MASAYTGNWRFAMTDRYDGNEAQNRKIANQLFDAWTEGEESNRKRRILVGSIPAWVACVLSIGLLVWNAAVISGNVADNTRRITQIEADQRDAGRANSNMIDRMARIEAKIDIIVGEHKP
jgi:hypothetical protein